MDEKMKALIDALNEDLSNEYAAVIQYTVYSAKVKGPFREELRRFFQAEIPEESGHAQILSDKIVALGGKPTTTAAEVPDAKTPEEMLQAVLAAEKKAVEGYTARLDMADAVGDIALRIQLEDMIADEAKHRDGVALMLAGWK